MSRALLVSLVVVPLALAQPAREAELVALEKQTWKAFQERDEAALRKLIAEDFEAIYDNGVRGTRASMLADLKKFRLDSFTIEEAKVRALTREVSIVTYRLTYSGAEGKEKARTKVLLSSSTWVERGGKWVNVSYQETAAKK